MGIKKIELTESEERCRGKRIRIEVSIEDERW
jgi:hypothetical protein